MLMSAVAAHQRRDRLFRGEDSAASAKIITRGQLLLGGVAAVGLAVAMPSQHSGTGSQARLSVGTVFGVLMGLASGAVSALSVASSIAYGKILFYRLAERQPGDAGGGLPNLMSLLWLTMLGHVIAKLCSVPVALVTGAAVFGGLRRIYGPRHQSAGRRCVVGADDRRRFNAGTCRQYRNSEPGSECLVVRLAGARVGVAGHDWDKRPRG